ncbi:conserved hypothetical protein [Streptomyces himastatinicus ATCC 53653]|uniref:Uncharacterized protein n=1 Tax=Streptomyces himastatinicus ATCC 53653 TaxID=457427 RepID=D9WQ11_9ACTN|nr:conserved hypothetical protein [Streptomyces himastatinicus ATCC 53653]
MWPRAAARIRDGRPLGHRIPRLGQDRLGRATRQGRLLMPPVIARPTVVPFVTAWSGEPLGPESDLTVQLTPGPRLGYKASRETDRDTAGALWARMTHSPGTGRPIYDSMHIARQRICMYAMTCQICGDPASRDKDGWLLHGGASPGPTTSSRRADGVRGNRTSWSRTATSASASFSPPG